MANLNKEKLTQKIISCFCKYKKVFNDFNDITLCYENSKRNLIIHFKLNYFIHAIAIYKIPYYKKIPRKKIINLLEQKKFDLIKHLN